MVGYAYPFIAILLALLTLVSPLSPVPVVAGSIFHQREQC